MKSTSAVLSSPVILMSGDCIDSRNGWEEPIGGFRFVDNLDFLELLADKYNEEVAAELISTPSD
ncbi:hypothetical protein TSMEX_001221 [Taenia solium]|eukprot:TsM_000869900 transcript=TsM_000869900 gene=TsM_000869900